MKEEITTPMILYCNNRSVINILNKPMMPTKIEHIVIKYHYLRELVHDKEVKMKYANRKEKIDDIFKKKLPKDSHEYLRGKLGIIHLSKVD